jgi:hypothetical protein
MSLQPEVPPNDELIDDGTKLLTDTLAIVANKIVQPNNKRAVEKLLRDKEQLEAEVIRFSDDEYPQEKVDMSHISLLAQDIIAEHNHEGLVESAHITAELLARERPKD